MNHSNAEFPYTNHLINEKSPYLLSHAHNPVDWYPWCKEAFEKAKQENKPIFLSIGYSTCHWCHVMERESFENEDVAQLLNRYFISIKVDREERPDIDSVYMAVCQAVNQSGGWPLTTIMTPEQQPFFSATYLPRVNRGQTTGLIQVLGQIAHMWETEEQKLRQTGAAICSFLAQNSRKSRKETAQEKEQPDRNGENPHGSPTVLLAGSGTMTASHIGSWPDKAMLHRAAAIFRQTFDKEYGGFGQAPKFPTPHNLIFLLRYGKLEQNKTIEYIAAQTLFTMMRGGIFDHIGGGFSRYSTDRQWLTPHFEKMLYDNALLAMAYLECWEQTKAEWCLWAAKRIFTYVFRELTGEEGGFFCGQDADSEGVEGKYYTFSPEEIRQILGEERGQAFCRKYDITEKGNFEGKSIPNLIREDRPWIPAPDMEKDCETVYRYRLNRYPLHKDDKVLTSWSSLMAIACAKGARAAKQRFHQAQTSLTDQSNLDNNGDILEQCLMKAENSLNFIRRCLTGTDGRLMVRYRDGEAAHGGHLDDYAFYALALLTMYRTVFNISYLEEAVHVATVMTEYFSDREQGGFYLYASDSEQLISRPMDTYDGAMPSGNSAAAHVLCRLAGLTALPEWMEQRDRQLAFLTDEVKDYPSGYSFSLLAMMEVLYPSKELICVLPGSCEDSLKARLAAAPDYGLHILVKTPGNAKKLAQLAPFTADYPIGEKPMYYLCENGSCRQPMEDLEIVLGLL